MSILVASNPDLEPDWGRKRSDPTKKVRIQLDLNLQHCAYI
jgi:hypothetical protein